MASIFPDGWLIPELNHFHMPSAWTSGRHPADTARLKAESQSGDFPRRVLLVDSSIRECAQLRNELIASQMEVFTAGDVITATRALASFRPNLILSHLRLPTYDGMELVRRVKDNCSTRLIPVILYSDITTTEQRVKALELGAADFLSKPFVRAELMTRVRAALRARHTLSVMEQRAHLDGLTGLANRGVLEDQLVREWDACRRRRVPLSVAIVDLDHFKAINDLYGHAAGDDVLRQTAKTLALSVRSSDLVARYGGEEFVVVAPDCPTPAATIFAQRFRTQLAEHRMFDQGAELVVTASVGIATTDGTQGGPAELLRRADQALYGAKRSGRNAVWMYDPSQGSPVVAIASGAAAC